MKLHASGGKEPVSPSEPLRASGRRWRAVFFALAMTGILVGVAWALLGSRLLVVRSVVVTGTHLVPAAEVIAAAGVQPGTPLIRVNTGQVAARVESIRQVRTAVVIDAIAEPGDLVLTRGAGDITALGPRLVETLAGPPGMPGRSSPRG